MKRLPPIVSKLMPSLGRDNDHEIVATVRAIGSALRGAGLDFHDLARALGPKTEPIVFSSSHNRSRASSGYRAQSNDSDYNRAMWLTIFGRTHLNEREQEFVSDLSRRLGPCGSRATPKQAAWLDALYFRATGKAA